MRYHLTSVRIAVINRTNNNNVGEDVEKKESSYTAGGTANWYSHYETSMEVLQKNGSTMLSSNPSTGYLPQRFENSYPKRYLHTDVHSSIIHGGQDMEATKVS